MTDSDRFEHRYAEALYEIAKYSQYLWRQGGHAPTRGIAKRLQDEIRNALLEEESDDDPGPDTAV